MGWPRQETETSRHSDLQRAPTDDHRHHGHHGRNRHHRRRHHHYHHPYHYHRRRHHRPMAGPPNRRRFSVERPTGMRARLCLKGATHMVFMSLPGGGEGLDPGGGGEEGSDCVAYGPGAALNACVCVCVCVCVCACAGRNARCFYMGSIGGRTSRRAPRRAGGPAVGQALGRVCKNACAWRNRNVGELEKTRQPYCNPTAELHNNIFWARETVKKQFFPDLNFWTAKLSGAIF